jgi:CubicO group peptidase (beta-lactamase class C family)
MFRMAMLVVVTFVSVFPAQAQTVAQETVKGKLGFKLDQAARGAGGRDFWGAVLVARGGEILLAKGYGKADYAVVPNTPLTLFELASASKQVTATAILHLVQTGKLKVTDTLDTTWKGLPADKKKVQVHHLLTHTSGLSRKLGVPYSSKIERADYVKAMLKEPLVAEPGAVFAYSNVGYALLAAIVEEVSGGSFEAYCEKHLFAPAGLSDTGFINDQDLVKSGRASRRRMPRGRWTAARWYWGWGYKGMGGTVTTVIDLLKWDRALRGDTVLNEASRRALYTPYKSRYAYGWKVDVTDRGTRKVHHAGGVAGYGINVVRYLEEDVCVFVLTNDGRDAYAVTAALERHLFPSAKLQALIDVTPYKLPSPPILELPKTVFWSAAKSAERVWMSLHDGQHTVLKITAPASYLKKLIASLEQAIATREADDDGAPPRTEAGLYLQPYKKPLSRISLDEQLTLDIQSEYRGRDKDGNPVVDKRVLIVLKDAKHMQWPCMAKLNVAAARALLAQLKK